MISKERLCEVILSPLMTEKSYLVGGGARKQVLFKVRTDATKLEIKEAVEFLLDTKVDSVRTLNVKGKSRVFRQIPGKRQSWKKAFVSLQRGCDINFVTES
jgi:large subunit ribosomal protein L23